MVPGGRSPPALPPAFLVGQFQRVVTDPAYAVGLFNTIFDGIEELMAKVQARMDEEPEGIAGIIDTVSKIAQPTKIIQDAIAEKALGAFRDFIADKRPTIIALVDKISRIMFPVIFGLLASYQILMMGEWKVPVTETGRSALHCGVSIFCAQCAALCSGTSWAQSSAASCDAKRRDVGGDASRK